MNVEIKILNKEFYKEHDLPKYATPGSVAMDLLCTRDVTILPGESVDIHTGLAIWIGSKCHEDKWSFFNSPYVSVAAQIMPRSGLGKQGLVLGNTIGLIDEDYQGELIVNVWNRLKSESSIRKLKAGDRFAQLMFVAPVLKANWNVVDEFSENTERGTGGFGSTGV